MPRSRVIAIVALRSWAPASADRSYVAEALVPAGRGHGSKAVVRWLRDRARPDVAFLVHWNLYRQTGEALPTLVTFEAMLLGYTEAINRFDAAANKNDPIGSYTALFEALNWAVALDDRTDAHLVLAQAGEVAMARTHPQTRRSWPEFDCANSVHHQSTTRSCSARAHVPTGTPLPAERMGLAARRPASPPRPDKKPHAESETFYHEQMEGRSVRLYLDVLGGVFLTLQHLLLAVTIAMSPARSTTMSFPRTKRGVLPDSGFGAPRASELHVRLAQIESGECRQVCWRTRHGFRDALQWEPAHGLWSFPDRAS